MRYNGVKMLVLMCVVLMGIGLVAPEAASAHKELTSGDYAIEMGFNQEPALQGDLNGLYPLGDELQDEHAGHRAGQHAEGRDRLRRRQAHADARAPGGPGWCLHRLGSAD